MTNNDELALKLKAAAEKFKTAYEKYNRQEIKAGEYFSASSDYRQITMNSENILSLLAESDADKKQLDRLVADRMNLLKTMSVYVHAYEEAKSHVAELEARTVSVKLPETSVGEAGDFISHAEVVSLRDLRNLCDRAGIKLEVGE